MPSDVHYFFPSIRTSLDTFFLYKNIIPIIKANLLHTTKARRANVYFPRKYKPYIEANVVSGIMSPVVQLSLSQVSLKNI